MKRIIYLVLFLIVIIGFGSCKSKKVSVRSNSPVEAKANGGLFADMLANEIEFTTFTSKLNLRVKTGTRSISSKANLKIINGQMLQMSIQPLFGVEMFRLFVDNDTLVLLDRMNKRYVQEALPDLKKRYPVGFDYETVQSLLTNKLFLAEKKEVTPSDYRNFSYSNASDNYYLSAKDNSSDIEYSFTVNGSDKITFSHLLDPESSNSLRWSYSNFILLDSLIFPYQMDVSAVTPKRKLDVGITFSDIVLDEPMELSINIPSGYTKVTISDIL